MKNWRQNLRRRGGFWRDGRWYDLHLERRMPLVIPMLEEMVAALPPLGADTSVCDLGCGTGNASFVILTAYPMIRLTLVDEDAEVLAIASEKLSEFSKDFTVQNVTVEANGEAVPGGPYDVIVASLALHSMLGTDVDGAEAEGRYELLLQGVADALTPGGHLIVADQVGTMGLYRQMKAMERAGFTDVDCAWRQDEFFVCGGRMGE